MSRIRDLVITDWHTRQGEVEDQRIGKIMAIIKA